MSMQALAAQRYGTYKDALKLQSVAKCTDTLAATDVLISVSYSDVNPVDLQKLSGGPKHGQKVGSDTEDAVFIPGYGGSGTIVKVGSDVPSNLLEGNRICFLGDPSRLGQGSYSEFVTVDYRCVAKVPDSISLQEASIVALSGCTALESLEKMQIVSSDQRLLIVGAAGGVGSWAITLARARHATLDIIATVSSPESSEWCLEQGASRTILHDEIEASLKAQPVDAILCLTEPTGPLFKTLAEVIRPYGRICLVVAGQSIQSMDLGFCFFKSVTILTETVFSSIRTKFQFIQPAEEIDTILRLVELRKVRLPISPQLTSLQTDWKSACEDNGVLSAIASGHARGKFYLTVSPE